MASPQGNRIALEDVMLGMFPQRPAHLVQERLGETRSPFYVREIAAGSNWVEVQGDGYEVLCLAGDSVQQLGGEPSYLKFGNQGPASTADTDTTGAIAVLPGTCIPVPQGFRKLWFRPSADSNWRLVVSKAPGVHIDYGPYAYRLPPKAVISATQIVTPLPTDEPSLVTHGMPVPSRAKDVTVHIYCMDAQEVPQPARLAADVSLELWWYPPTTDGGIALWSHNPHDDFDALGLGVANGAHDVERYSCEGVSRLYVRRTSGDDTDRTCVDVIFYG